MHPPEQDRFQKAWQRAVKPSEKEISVSTIRRRSARLNRTVRIRNMFEYVAAVFVAVLFGVMAFQGVNWLWVVSCIEIVLASLWIVAVLWRRGRSVPDLSPGLPTSTYLANYRAGLQRQEKLLRWAWAWYVLPVVIGILGFMASMAMMLPPSVRLTDAPLRVWLIVGVTVVGLPLLIAIANRVAARKLRETIDALPSLDNG